MDFPKRGGAVAWLPDDLLMEILSRVPVKSLCRFKCVSKTWRELIADPPPPPEAPPDLGGSSAASGDVAHHSSQDVQK
ncbi:F-box protein At1g31080-like [Panicum virgatum]|uniref:F-box protein At1g31080-like n=1 Tax=Panicum virgatum TaxID=38727 RepID=UPI0019D61865|nr:F-box protein At1g31080-like [Panicum virgatum]